MKCMRDGQSSIVGVAVRCGVVGLLAVVPMVTEGIPIDGFRSFAGIERGGERVEVHLPADHVVIACQAGPVAVAVLVEAVFAGFAVAPGSEDGAGVVVETVELFGRRGPRWDEGEPFAEEEEWTGL